MKRLLKNLVTSWSGGARRRSATAPATRARPAVEQLEDRQLLSITLSYLFHQSPQSLGGTALRQVSETIDGGGRQVVVALGGNYAVYERTETAPGSLTWTGWQFLGGNVQSVKVATDYAGTARVFSLGWDGCVYTIAQQVGGNLSQVPGWGTWSDLGGNNVCQFDVSNFGYLTVYAVGADHQLSFNEQALGGSTSGWNGWHTMGGSLLSVAVVSDPSYWPSGFNTTLVIGLGTDHSVSEGYDYWTGAKGYQWQWNPLGGHDIQQIAVGESSGGVTVFAIGGNQALYCNQCTWSSSGDPVWSGWVNLGGSVQSISVSTPTNQVFALGTDGHAYDIRLSSQGLSATWVQLWGQWSSIVAGSANNYGVFLGISLSDSSVYEQVF
jgi:hypothetical protein